MQPIRNGVQPVAGLLLAAGGGRRLGGRPKALLPHRGRPLVEHALRVLREAGCGPLHVVLGAAADEVREQADLTGCTPVDNPRWAEGMGTSLRTGLASLGAGRGAPGTDESADGRTDGPGAALVLLVDQPGIGARAVARVAAAYGGSTGVLASATYGGDRGHPVLLGAGHWDGVAADAVGDRGARGYLRAHRAEITLVECGDVAEPYDIDTPEDLARLE
ncbi:nucleotidyltransferase family protein [Streptomyces montanisoli]|uniref:Nucleotidyltransferase family protein n=1 Tax=Streptomyces montanisoli TaxID=2798581 RepID=A0A940RUY2_9ACTN|nr:nucleotidyltransferase family protein [Streptomyces montanisoli]MBP0458467.1 nucleotidyltransferase family protein [Streptomyces montanisoli]